VIPIHTAAITVIRKMLSRRTTLWGQ